MRRLSATIRNTRTTHATSRIGLLLSIGLMALPLMFGASMATAAKISLSEKQMEDAGKPNETRPVSRLGFRLDHQAAFLSASMNSAA
ncbi:MAG: hypothetical protein QF570_19420 [Myxococcota bacterium]|jgi:hypothetical protein|nr:hypothetical protein [Myxococcota bacterium]